MLTIKKRKKRLKDTRCETRTVVSADIKGAMLVISKLKLVNISNKGALIKTPQRLSVGSIFKVNFAHDNDERKPITLQCEVVRCGYTKTIFGDNGEPIPLYLAGLKFIKLDEDLIKELKTFIAKEEIIMKKRDRKKNPK
jgi:hypothetical protein